MQGSQDLARLRVRAQGVQPSRWDGRKVSFAAILFCSLGPDFDGFRGDLGTRVRNHEGLAAADRQNHRHTTIVVPLASEIEARDHG